MLGLDQHLETCKRNNYLEASIRETSLNESFLDIVHQIVHDHLVLYVLLFFVFRGSWMLHC